MLALDRRRALHAAVLAVGERFYASQAGERAAWLAFHAIRGHAWDRAVSHLRTAAVRAIARAANRVAAQHLESALAALDRLPPSRERTSLAIDVRIDLRHALTPLGQVQNARSPPRGRRTRSKLGTPREWDGWRHSSSTVSSYKGDIERPWSRERALDLARELDDDALHVATQVYVARARLSRGSANPPSRCFEESSSPRQAATR
jgi:hypothetical protein